jgi:hypothetical protein
MQVVCDKLFLALFICSLQYEHKVHAYLVLPIQGANRDVIDISPFGFSGSLYGIILLVYYFQKPFKFILLEYLFLSSPLFLVLLCMQDFFITFSCTYKCLHM